MIHFESSLHNLFCGKVKMVGSYWDAKIEMDESKN
jgi:hypothetical protein